VLGFADETWWSRLTSPTRHAWAEAGRPLRLVEQTVATDDPDPKALAAYGRYLPADNEVLPRFADGRPVSALTTQFLAWCCDRLAARGIRALLLVWNNTGWHIGKEVRVAARAQSPRQARGPGRADRRLPPARQAPLAQPDRAQVGPRQAPRRRTRRPAHRAGNRRAGVRRPRLRLRTASRPPTPGRLIMH